MPEQCKVWFVPTDRFRGLCGQLYDPMTGTDECPVCVQPYMMDEVVDCGPCLTTDEFSPVYKIATSFNPPGSNLNGGLYSMTRSYTRPPNSTYYPNTTLTVTYNRYLFTFNWDDFKKLWNSPLVRIQQPVSPPVQNQSECYENVCTWHRAVTQVIGCRSLPYKDVNPSYPFKFESFFSGISKANWPQRLQASQWNTSTNGYPCAYYSAADPEYHLSVNTNSGQKPMYTPDRNEKWPAGFGSLSGTSMKSFKFSNGGNRSLQGTQYELAYPGIPNTSNMYKEALQGVMLTSVTLNANTTSQGAKLYWTMSITNRYYDLYWTIIFDTAFNRYLNYLPTWGGNTTILEPWQAYQLLGPQPNSLDWLHPHIGEGQSTPGDLALNSGYYEYTVNYKSDPMVCSARNLFTLTRINSGGSPATTPSVFPNKLIIRAGS